MTYMPASWPAAARHAQLSSGLTKWHLITFALLPTPPQVRNFKTAGTSISLTLGQKELPMYCT